MNKYFFLVLMMITSSMTVFSQKYLTKTGLVSFYSKTPLETIQADNKATAIMLNTVDQKLDVVVLVKSFVFEKQLMQEHFNENYLESDKYPKATFKGVISQPASLNWSADGEYEVTVSGKLSMHGQTKDVSEKGKVNIKNGKISLQSSFNVLLSDYNISIPAAVKDKVAKQVRIDIKGTLDPIK